MLRPFAEAGARLFATPSDTAFVTSRGGGGGARWALVGLSRGVGRRSSRRTPKESDSGLRTADNLRSEGAAVKQNNN